MSRGSKATTPQTWHSADCRKREDGSLESCKCVTQPHGHIASETTPPAQVPSPSPSLCSLLHVSLVTCLLPCGTSLQIAREAVSASPPAELTRRSPSAVRPAPPASSLLPAGPPWLRLRVSSSSTTLFMSSCGEALFHSAGLSRSGRTSVSDAKPVATCTGLCDASFVSRRTLADDRDEPSGEEGEAG